MGAWGIGHWVVVLLIALIVFGTRRLTAGAKDLANAVKEFKKALHDDDGAKAAQPQQQPILPQVVGEPEKHNDPNHRSSV